MSTFITDYSSYCWTVQNFRLFDSIGTYHTSPIFRLCDRDWTLRLYPCGKRDRKYVGVYLENIGSMGIIVDWKIDVLDAKQERVGGYTACNCRYIPKQSNAGTAQLISRKNALDALENGHLHLKCSIRLTNEQAVLSSNSTYEDAVNLDLSKIYSGLLDSGLFSDFTIKVQGQTFKAHRAILATQSSYFKNMLSHQMTEAAEQSVTMDDVDPEIFRYLLYFLYTGQCGNKETKTEGDKKEEALYCQLLMAADRFGVGRLATVCVDRLCSIVTAQNAAEMLVFAERLNHLILKEYVLKYICASKQVTADVFASEGFKLLQPDHLRDIIRVSSGANINKKREREEEKTIENEPDAKRQNCNVLSLDS